MRRTLPTIILAAGLAAGGAAWADSSSSSRSSAKVKDGVATATATVRRTVNGVTTVRRSTSTGPGTRATARAGTLDPDAFAARIERRFERSIRRSRTRF